MYEKIINLINENNGMDTAEEVRKCLKEYFAQ